MPRKKSICSVNAALQIDGKVHITLRVHGQEVHLNAIEHGHGRKIYRAVSELERFMRGFEKKHES